MSSILIYNETKQKWELSNSGDRNMSIVSKNKCSIGVQVNKKTGKMLKAFLNRSGSANNLLLPDFMSQNIKGMAKYDLRYSKKTMEPYLRDVSINESDSSIALISLNSNYKKVINVELNHARVIEYSLPKKHSKEKCIDLIVHFESKNSYIKLTLYNQKEAVEEITFISLNDIIKTSVPVKEISDASYKFKKMRPYYLTELLLVDEGYEDALNKWLIKNKRNKKHVVAVLPKDPYKQDQVIKDLISKGYRAITYMDGFAKENKKKKQFVLNKLSNSFRFIFTTRYRENKKNRSVKRIK